MLEKAIHKQNYNFQKNLQKDEKTYEQPIQFDSAAF